MAWRRLYSLSRHEEITTTWGDYRKVLDAAEFRQSLDGIIDKRSFMKYSDVAVVVILPRRFPGGFAGAQ